MKSNSKNHLMDYFDISAKKVCEGIGVTYESLMTWSAIETFNPVAVQVLRLALAQVFERETEQIRKELNQAKKELLAQGVSEKKMKRFYLMEQGLLGLTAKTTDIRRDIARFRAFGVECFIGTFDYESLCGDKTQLIRLRSVAVNDKTSLRYLVLNDFFGSFLSISEISKKYKLAPETVGYWIDQFFADKNSVNKPFFRAKRVGLDFDFIEKMIPLEKEVKNSDNEKKLRTLLLLKEKTAKEVAMLTNISIQTLNFYRQWYKEYCMKIND